MYDSLFPTISIKQTKFTIPVCERCLTWHSADVHTTADAILDLCLGEREDFRKLVFTARKIFGHSCNVEAKLSLLKGRNRIRKLNFTFRNARHHQTLLGSALWRIGSAWFGQLSATSWRRFFNEVIGRTLLRKACFFAV